jgi:DDE_Tnp_1-associated
MVRKNQKQWLEEFLELPNGIPSDDTFRRVFEKLDPKVLEQKLSQWLQQIMGSVFQEIIPIDGKSLRGSYDREKGLKSLHLVTAWASEQRLVLGQVKVEDHSNEITAIPALLELIDVLWTQGLCMISQATYAESFSNSPIKFPHISSLRVQCPQITFYQHPINFGTHAKFLTASTRKFKSRVVIGRRSTFPT